MGPAATVNYEAAGASDDWAKVFTIFTIIDNDQHHAMRDDWAKVVSIVMIHQHFNIQGSAGIKYSYTVELPDSLNGKHR